jgi:hypothetical protein
VSLLETISWHARGPFAVSPIRDIGFAAREWFQPREVQTRRKMVAELLASARPYVEIDPAHGYARLPHGNPAALDDLCATGSKIAGPTVGVVLGGKEFFRRRFSRDEELEVLLRAALDPRLLATVAKYLGELPVISDADYYCSVPYGPPWSKSQLWHCDDDGARIVKLFIYCEDVTAENGPFEFIDATHSARARAGVGYRYAGRRYRVDDASMSEHVASTDQLAIEGPRATAFLVDTAHCFHRGSRIVAKDRRRVAAIVCYCPASGRKLPLRLARGTAPLARFAAMFTDRFQRAALGLPVV